MKKTTAYLLLFLLALAGAQAQNALQAALHTWVADKDLADAAISIAIIDADTKQLAASWDSHAQLTPASTLKILSTATALIALGGEYRFKTELQYDGYIDAAGVLHGNIYLKGYGDPTLGSDQMPEAKKLEDVLQACLQALKNEGIKKATGSVIGDASFYSGPPTPASWPEEDAGNYYGAGAWALNIHENFYYLPFKQNPKLGAAPTILDPVPAVSGMSFVNEVRSGARGSGDNAFIYGGPYVFRCVIKGTIPLGSGVFRIKGATPDPPLQAAQLLHAALVKGGIDIAKAPAKMERSVPGSRKTIYTHQSPTLEQIVARANLESVNLYCEALLPALGVKKYGEGTRAAGLRAIREIWADRGLPIDERFIADGSGLSMENRMSSYQLAQIVRKIHADPALWQIFAPSLPVAGKTGTLKEMLKGTAAEGRIQAKSGSMKSVRSYAGVARTKNGRSLVFCMIANNFSCSGYAMRKKMEQLMLRIALE
jgi:serine-type D-Ala-D-Ala carboxypeptidase/endopeptidase (penicillin-binding protein 4)